MPTLKYPRLIFTLLCLAAALDACRDVDYVIPPTEEDTGAGSGGSGAVSGFYLLNEGNMGSNKASLDFYDFSTGVYMRNIYSDRNPTTVKELGDVGNDIQVYGSRLYVVVNCSNKVEVLNAATGVRIGHVDIPNCRYVRFAGGKAYVSSYVGPVSLDKGRATRGAVYEVDTASLAITRVCQVGYQPEELEIMDDGLIYVANSGGYMAPDYEDEISVVDIESMTEVRRIKVGINLHRVRRDSHGRLWVSSRGDYEGVPSNLFLLGRSVDNPDIHVIDTLDMPCSEMAIRGDSLFFIASEWDNYEQKNTVSYGIINTRTRQLVTSHFITDGTEADITMPYGLALHPTLGDIYVTDAKNYVSSGSLMCYSRDGKLKWTVKTGDIPAHIVFLGVKPSGSGGGSIIEDDADKDPDDDDGKLEALYDHVFRVPRLKKLFLEADLVAYSYRWTMRTDDGGEELLSTDRRCLLIPETVGDTLLMDVRMGMADGDFVSESYAIVVTRESKAYSPYTAIGYEYRPAPGQFVNTMPPYEEGDDEADMARKAGQCLANDEMVSLGAYGGYVTFGFDHTIVNHRGESDFHINGNAFYSDVAQYSSRRGGSCEPGIVMVSLDANGNGVPDDPWYELAGSAFHYPDSCRRDYEVTYFRTGEDHAAVPDPADNSVTDAEYIMWVDNDGRSGHVPKNVFHKQDYYPAWIAADEMTFRGSLLRQNAVETSGEKRYYVLYAYWWGYVDNHPNAALGLTSFDIDWAVDEAGRSVSLPGVDFIRVYTSVNQACGWLGETSTEVGRATDLWL